MEAGGFVLYISNRMQKRQQRVPGRLDGSPFMDYPEFTPVNRESVRVSGFPNAIDELPGTLPKSS